jgi:hypothetical protein
LLNFQSAQNVMKTVPLRSSCLPDSDGIFTFSNGCRMKKISRYVRQAKQAKNLDADCTSPFKIVDKIGNNAFRLDFPPYIQMYVVVNVENLKLYEPPLIDDQGEHVQIPSIDYFSPKYLTEL